jgi:signal transduction histidine kinase
MNTLLARLSVALLSILLLIGGGFFALAQFSTRLYYEEITQRLNASIAMYVTGERQLMQDGVADRDALALLAQQAMVINPSVEIYLLDATGRILAHALPAADVIATEVDLGPVQAMLAGALDMPLKGSDPRDTARSTIFSAAPVMHDGELQGYLYAVLGGAKYRALAADLRGSYVQSLTLGVLAAIVLAAFLTGSLVFALLTRRLVRLTHDVQQFTAADFDPALISVLSSANISAAAAGDEISQLQHAFAGMSARIRDQLEELRQTDKLRRELISNVSHDLRTPLASIHGYVETLLIKNDELSAEDRLRYLQTTHTHSKHLSRLVSELFELSRLEADSVRPVLEHFSLAELLHDVAQEFELQAQQQGVALIVETQSPSSMVLADIGLIQRVLENLIRNALRFTPQHGTITLSLSGRDNAVEVAVADTGCGIPQPELDKVFDRYYRSAATRAANADCRAGDAAGSASDVSSSAGLGLAIVRKILDLHGSRITVYSKAEQGTRFEFALPMQQAA